MDNHILLVDDEPNILFSYKTTLQSEGMNNISTMQDSRQVMPFLKQHDISAIVLDLYMPYVSGNELLVQIKQNYPQMPVIVITAEDQIETAVQCMRAGAFDYQVKPVENTRFISSIKRAIETESLRDELSTLKESFLSDGVKHETAFSGIVTQSDRMKTIFKYIEAVTKSLHPILILGETGTGKDLIARSIHETSGVKGDFVPVNVAGLDDNMFSDTLFGHTKGAFTGADQSREGLVCKATGGTLFLDEIGDLDEASQVKLLRLLEDRRYYQIGSDVLSETNASILTATSRNLLEMANEGKFRKDLYYRMYAHQIALPPLRERMEDLPALIEHFIRKASKSMGKKTPRFPTELVMLLSTYQFPGNIRELEAMVLNAVATSDSEMLALRSFKDTVGTAGALSMTVPLKDNSGATKLENIFGHFPALKEAEAYLVSQAMVLSKGNQGIAASLLGISRQALNKRLSKNKPDQTP